ncbi:MAG: tyrosine-type recombinase/integrase [Paracoccaceae bacterium]
MTLQNSPRNINHPRKGSSIKVEPIRRLDDIAAIKTLLAHNPRDLCLFTFGINTAYRAGEILSLTVGQVAHLNVGDRLEIKQSKTQKYRSATLNRPVVTSVQVWLKHHPNPNADAPLFVSRTGKKALKVSSVNAMIKSWCDEISLAGNYGTHSMRKTWGYHQRIQKNRPIPLLMVAYGHTTQAQTLDYLCIQDEEIRDLYDLEL